uniref:Uncharacterized protein n=1 Tax=Opuntia streptacantha TaxID=393608 RepID=A0A7C8YI40_OPUST
MDIACSFNQSNLIRGVECKRFGTSDFLHSNLGSRISGFGYRNVRPSRLVLRMCLYKNARIIGNFGVASPSKSPSGGVSTGHLRGMQLRKPRIGGFEDDSEILSLVGVAQCQSGDAAVFIDGNGQNVEVWQDIGEESVREEDSSGPSGSGSNGSVGDEKEAEERPNVDELKELLQKARRDLEVARLNSTMFEEKAQKISETAIALKDQAENARSDVNKTLIMIE